MIKKAKNLSALYYRNCECFHFKHLISMRFNFNKCTVAQRVEFEIKAHDNTVKYVLGIA